MKFVRLQSRFPMKKVENNLKRADYYVDEGEEKFTAWSLADYNKNETGIHVSYDKEKKKITAYYEDGVDHKNFLTPITEIFSGKLSEKDGVTFIKGHIGMSPIFNVLAALVYLGLIGLFAAFPKQEANITIFALIFVIYFVYTKKAYRHTMDRIAIFLDSITYSATKEKKNNPNKKKGKWAGKHI